MDEVEEAKKILKEIRLEIIPEEAEVVSITTKSVGEYVYPIVKWCVQGKWKTKNIRPEETEKIRKEIELYRLKKKLRKAVEKAETLRKLGKKIPNKLKQKIKQLTQKIKEIQQEQNKKKKEEKQ